jgi:pyridinium-3,5-bisthiocarboxylic acid mononucleotide nickel chelatase
MRIAYLDCFAGISGDMFLGALMDVGVPLEVLQAATSALGVGASLKLETVDRSGISAKKVWVLENGRLAEAAGESSPSHDHAHEGGDARRHTHEHSHSHEREHMHKDPHEHAHEPTHGHVRGRSLTEIRGLIQGAKLASEVKEFAIRTFELLGQAEAKIHNVPVEKIHFHEVGAVDAIVDIVAAGAGVHHLGVDAWHASALNVGGGMVDCAHGRFPVPAPAAADLLRGFPTYSAHVERELVTPTGAALLRALNPLFGQQPVMRVEAIGYGAGTANPKGFADVLRLSVGERAQDALVSAAPVRRENAAQREPAFASGHRHEEGEMVTVIETALDDLSPQVLAYVAEKALAAGALDVMLTPVVMKKGRPGTLLTVLCDPAESATFEQMILRETTTLGVRVRRDRRVCLERRHAPVETAYGAIRMKIGLENGEERNAAPEFEDCRAAAERHGVALKLVQQAAIAAYRRQDG